MDSPDTPPPADAPLAPGTEFAAHRFPTVVTLVSVALMFVVNLWAGLQGYTNKWEYVFLGLWGLVIVVLLAQLRNPARLLVTSDSLTSTGAFSFRTTPGNLAGVTFDDGSLRIVFHDFQGVEALGAHQKAPDQLFKVFELNRKQKGAHVLLPGFTLAEVEAIRQILGLAKPAPDTAGGAIEGFQRILYEITPRLAAVYVLIGLNLAIYAAMVATGVHPYTPTAQNLVDWGANYGPLTTGGEWYRLLTSMFLHIGFFHLFCNMWSLYEIGRLMERLLGAVGFLLLYLIAGIAGSVASLAWNPQVISAGASGAVFGVYGGLLGFILVHRHTIPPDVLRNLRNSGIFFLGYNLFYGTTTTGIDQAAHVGGLVAGFVGGLILSQPVRREMLAGRTLRNAMLVVAGFVGIVLGAAQIPEATSDPTGIVSAFKDFGDMEKRTLDLYNQAAQRLQRNELTEAAFCELVERDILPPWRQIEQRFAAFQNLPEPTRKRMPMFMEYLTTRQQAWELVLRSIRERDPALSGQAQAKFESANRLAQQLQQPEPR